MRRYLPRAFGLILACFALLAIPSKAQVVDVTLSLDTSRLAVGASTTLRAYAQVVTAQRSSTDRIFSWYVDVLDSAGTIARANYASLQKPAADNDPSISSLGTTSGDNQTGIHDTFMNLAGAGVKTPVLLLTVPVTAVAPGRAVFSVQAGTGVSGLSEDFIVAPLGGGPPLTGGNYLQAQAELLVPGTVTNVPNIQVTLKRPVPAAGGRLDLSFTTLAGWNYYVEFRDALNSTSAWQPLPGAPFNFGAVTITNSAPRRFYRVKALP